jgi:hypothetical protein
MHPDVKSGGIRPRYNPPAPAKVVSLPLASRMRGMPMEGRTNQGYHRRARAGRKPFRLLPNFDCVKRLPNENAANA